MKEWKKISYIGANGNEAKGIEKGEDGLGIREVADLCEEETSVNDGVRIPKKPNNAPRKP